MCYGRAVGRRQNLSRSRPGASSSVAPGSGGIGLAGSIGLSFALKSIVYRMQGITVLPLALAMAAVGFAAMLACWIPAWRAAKLDPLEALRAD